MFPFFARSRLVRPPTGTNIFPSGPIQYFQLCWWYSIGAIQPQRSGGRVFESREDCRSGRSDAARRVERPSRKATRWHVASHDESSSPVAAPSGRFRPRNVADLGGRRKPKSHDHRPSGPGPTASDYTPSHRADLEPAARHSPFAVSGLCAPAGASGERHGEAPRSLVTQTYGFWTPAVNSTQS